MTTLKAAVRAAIVEAGPDNLGRVVPIASLTTTTAVASVLARGEASSKYADLAFITRRDTATTADRVRQVSAFAGSTGTFTHAGTNYGDTTATDELLEITMIDPESIDNAAQKTLAETRRFHEDIIPAHGGSTYYLDVYDWIARRGHVLRILRNAGPVLSRNGDFLGWNVISSAGALEPDNWVKTGTSSTWSRVTTNPYRGRPYELSVVRSTNDVTIEQFIGGGAESRSMLSDGVRTLATEGNTVTVVARVRGSVVGVRAFVDPDNSTPVYSSYNTGVTAYHEELSKEYTFDSNDTQASFGLKLDADGTYLAAECLLVFGTLDDTVRAREYESSEVVYDWKDLPTAVVISAGDRENRGGSYIIESLRPYSELDWTRVRAGTADADVSDIPETLWAWGILANLFKEQAVRDPAKYGPLASKYGAEYDRMRLQHMRDTSPPRERRRNFGRTPRRA